MKKAVFSIITLILIAGLAMSFVGCGNSTLLIGKWGDRNGNVLEILEDKTFTSEIAVGGVSETLVGSWEWVEGNDAINFLCEDGRVLLSFFEIDGGILTMTWTTNNVDSEILTLMRIE
ncbi:MAG: hypothetical protein K5839_06255 [Treponemataceae bacterium]|nr:hypothetical protein [Treponemataceae bacterium]